MDKRLIPGTLVWRKDLHLGLVYHYGVVLALGGARVAHIDKNQAGCLHVKIESLDEFAAGKKVTFELLETPVSLDAMWDRVQEVERSKRPFGLLNWGDDWNCETFARFVKKGIPESTQADAGNAALILAGAVAVLGALVSAAQDSTPARANSQSVTYDAALGRYRDGMGRFARAPS